MPLAAQCRKVRDIYWFPGTAAPQKSEKMRYLKNEGRVLWALGVNIFGGNDVCKCVSLIKEKTN